MTMRPTSYFAWLALLLVGVAIFPAAASAADAEPPAQESSLRDQFDRDHPQVEYAIRFLRASSDCVSQAGATWQHVRIPVAGVLSDRIDEDASDAKIGLVRVQATGTNELAVFATQLSDRSMLAAVLKEVQSDADYAMQFAPKVTVFEGQEWSVGGFASRPFFVGHSGLDTNDGSGDAIIETVEEGEGIKGVQTDPSTGRTRITVSRSDIRDVETVSIDRVMPKQLVLQNPAVDAESATFVTDLPDGGTVVIAFREITRTRFSRKTEWRYAFVTKRKLELPWVGED